MRYAKGQQFSPKVGPHAGHTLQVQDVSDVGPKHERVSIGCQTCHAFWRFLHHWGRFQ